MAKRERDGWLEDFSYVLTSSALRRIRRDPKYETFTGSKPLAAAWLILIAPFAGAFGGTLVSGTLWAQPLQGAAWLAAFLIFAFVARGPAHRIGGGPVTFLTGNAVFAGLMIGVVAMWGAQLSSPGWAYGIAGGMGLLVGICALLYEPEDLTNRDGYFTFGIFGGPIGPCLGAWLYRHGWLGEPSLAAAALAGAIAALVLLGPASAYFFAHFDNRGGLLRLATLLLHRDDKANEAIGLLDMALTLAPDDAGLFERRGMAHALAGSDRQAEADWDRHVALKPRSAAPHLARGWIALRQDRPAEAASWFERANKGRAKTWALVGLGIARLKLDDAAGAAEALDRVPAEQHDPLSLTYLAQARLALGQAETAEELATAAIEELDSVHGCSWIVRADARRALGDIDGAAKDYNAALWADDQEGIEQRAMAGLDAIGRPVEEDEPNC